MAKWTLSVIVIFFLAFLVYEVPIRYGPPVEVIGTVKRLNIFTDGVAAVALLDNGQSYSFCIAGNPPIWLNEHIDIIMAKRLHMNDSGCYYLQKLK